MPTRTSNESLSPNIKVEEGACVSEQSLGFTSASPYVHPAAHTQSANKAAEAAELAVDAEEVELAAAALLI